jgi:hypothetical protein
MSRATWYRKGKPPTKPVKLKVADLAQQVGASSTRTFQRLMRVLHDPELAPFVRAGLKPGQAEKMLRDPEHKRRFLRMYDDEVAKAKQAKRRKRRT